MHSLRSLAKSPLFTLAAIATLALGIGANTAVFSVLHSVVLQPMKFAQPEQIVLLAAENQARNVEGGGLCAMDIAELRPATKTLAVTAGVQFYYYNLTRISAPTQVTAGRATEDYFKIYGVAPQLGRTWLARDFQPGAADVAVIGHQLWQTKFGGDAAIIGRIVAADDKPYEIVGVMPAGFGDIHGLSDFWVPAPVDGTDAKDRGDRFFRGLGRLAPGATQEAARVELKTIAAGWAKARPATSEGWTLSVRRADELLVENVGTGLSLLMGAGACLLLITCANVGGLILARAQTRRREVAIRLALGATPGDLARQFLGEGLVLSLAGGGLGAFLAWQGVPLLTQVLPSWFPRTDEIAVNGTVLAVTALLSMLAGIAFGLLPVLNARRSVDPSRDLGARSGESRGAGRARAGLLVAEIALSVVLLTGAGLMVRTFLAIRSVSPGIRAEGLTAIVLSLNEARYPDRASRRVYYDALLERVRAVPGVQSASLSRTLPFTWGSMVEIEVDGRGAQPGESRGVFFDAVDADYLRTMGIPLLAGRQMQVTDSPTSSPIAFINQAMAKKYFGEADPVGRSIRVLDLPNKPVLQVIGVVGDVKRAGLTTAAPLQMYASYQQFAPGFAALMLRPDPRNSGAVLQQVQKAIWSVQPDQALGQIADMSTLVSNSAGVQRLGLILFVLFATVALLLAAVGLYGIIAYSVGARTREIGVRMALGARAEQIFSLILREGGWMVGLGLALGLAGSLAVAGLMAKLVYGITPFDPVSFAVVVPILLGVAFVAAALPARRATRIDPNVALRSE